MQMNDKSTQLMLGSSFCYSWIPVLVVALGGGESPFGFNCWYRVGGALGGLAVLVALWRLGGLSSLVWKAVWAGTRWVDVVFLLLQFFGFTLFAWATFYLDAAVVSMVYEAWPFLFMLLMGGVLGASRWFAKLTPRQGVLAVCCMLGVCMVVISEDGVGNIVNAGLVKGVSISFAGMFLSAMSYWNFRWCARVMDGLTRAPLGDGVGMLDWFSVLVIGFTLGSAVAALINGVLSVVFEPVFWSIGWPLCRVAALAALGAFLLDAGGTVCNRLAMLTAHRISVNTVHYATPVMSVVWLLILGMVAVSYVGLLLGGAALMTSCNVLLWWDRVGSSAASTSVRKP